VDHLVAVLLRQKDASKDGGLSRNIAVLLHCMLLLQSNSSLMRPQQQQPLMIAQLAALANLDEMLMRLGLSNHAAVWPYMFSSSTVTPPSTEAMLSPSVLARQTVGNVLSATTARGCLNAKHCSGYT
jgi:hypothetical protein